MTYPPHYGEEWDGEEGGREEGKGKGRWEGRRKGREIEGAGRELFNVITNLTRNQRKDVKVREMYNKLSKEIACLCESVCVSSAYPWIVCLHSHTKTKSRS